VNCRSVGPRLSSLIDDQLSESETKSVAEHLANCEACRREELELRSLKDLLCSCRTPYPQCEDLDPAFEARLVSLIQTGCSQQECGFRRERTRFDHVYVWHTAPAMLLVAWLISQTVLPSEAASSPKAKNRSPLGIASPHSSFDLDLLTPTRSIVPVTFQR
jgi:anti-sigma factor RsiW